MLGEGAGDEAAIGFTLPTKAAFASANLQTRPGELAMRRLHHSFRGLH